jgi:hypothetical protein
MAYRLERGLCGIVGRTSTMQAMSRRGQLTSRASEALTEAVSLSGQAWKPAITCIYSRSGVM